MIISGIKAITIASIPTNVPCQNCKKNDTVQLSVLQKYFHVFWIPFIPIFKTGVSKCTYCKIELKRKAFTGELANVYAKLKINSKTPLWTFSGLALFAMLIAWGVNGNHETYAKNEKLIETPQKGDMYEIKLAVGQYTLYHVDRVSADTVFVFAYSKQTNKIWKLITLKSDGGGTFIKSPIPILKSKLKQMLKKGEIYDIERK